MERSTLYRELPRPFLALAPMEDVTDPVFRALVARTAAPHLLFSEFTSAAGIASERPSALRRLTHAPDLPPLLVQIWGNDPDTCAAAVRKVRSWGFAGVDLNMGCPQPKITRKGRCSALIRQPDLAAQLVRAVSVAAREPGDTPPLAVSVKTRIGFERPIPELWLGMLLDLELDALHVHFRTVAEMSDVPARWEFADLLRELRDRRNPRTVLVGNGDVIDAEHALLLHGRHGLDGYMIGRGILASPWAFAPRAQLHAPSERLAFALEHTKAHQAFYPEAQSFPVLKKFYKAWADCFVGAPGIRTELMGAESHGQAERILLRAIADHRSAEGQAVGALPLLAG